METKRCTKCGQDKPATTEFFHKQASNKDGLFGRCRICENERSKLAMAEKYQNDHEWREKRNERNRLAQSKKRQNDPKWREKQESTRLAKAKKRQDSENREKVNQATLDWAINNPDKANANAIVASRKAYRLEADPCHKSKPSAEAWTALEADKIAEIYSKAAKRNLQVDHIDPLRPSENLPKWAQPLAEAAKKLPEPVGAHPKFRVRYGLVCGLHISSNFVLMSRSEYSSESNSFTPYRETDSQICYLSKDGTTWF